MDILDELKKLAKELEDKGIDYALCGGLAIAVYARPRATLDIDIMIDSDSVSRTTAAVNDMGFTISGPPMYFHDNAVVIHRFVKIDRNTGEHLVLDLIIATQTIQKAWEDRITIDWDGYPLKVLSPPGLILLKSLRNSGQDKDDIEYLRSLEYEDQD